MPDDLAAAMTARMRKQHAEGRQREQEVAGRSFTPDASMEALARAAEIDSTVTSRLGVGVEFGIYARGRRAAIEAGSFDPEQFMKEHESW